MSVEELAATVCEALRREGITVTLTGGACVAIWSNGKYASHDLDFIEEGPVPRRKLTQVLAALGFNPAGRHFVHADTPLFIEFPAGPLMVGNQRVERVSERDTPVGKARLLSPTDCIKDRLAAFYHWNDATAAERHAEKQARGEVMSASVNAILPVCDRKSSAVNLKSPYGKSRCRSRRAAPLCGGFESIQ